MFYEHYRVSFCLKDLGEVFESTVFFWGSTSSFVTSPTSTDAVLYDQYISDSSGVLDTHVPLSCPKTGKTPAG